MASAVDVGRSYYNYSNNTGCIGNYYSPEVRKRRNRSLGDADFSSFQNQYCNYYDAAAGLANLRKRYRSLDATTTTDDVYLFYDDTDISRLSPNSRSLLFGGVDPLGPPISKSSSSVAGKEEVDYDSDYEDCKDRVSHEKYLELKRKYNMWRDSGSIAKKGLFDTSEAFKLEGLENVPGVLELARQCRERWIIQIFTFPNQPWHDSSLCSYDGDKLEKYQSDSAHIAALYYNSVINKPDKLKIVSMLKVNIATGMFFELFMTFTASDSDTGLIGTYQAAALAKFDYPSFCPIDYHLVFLRHVEADKVLAIVEA